MYEAFTVYYLHVHVGAIRQKLKQKLQRQILKLKAQDRKMYEERRKMDEEEMDEELDELSKLETQLSEEDMSDEEDTDNEDEEWKRESRETKEEKEFKGTSDRESENEEGSDDEGSDDIDEEGSDNNDKEGSDSEDDMCFTSSWAGKRKRFIESDEEEDNQVTENKSISGTQRTNDNEIVTHKPTDNLPSNTDSSRDSESCDVSNKSHDTDEDSHDIIKDLHVHQSIEDAASMGPLIFNEGTLDHTETLDYPIVTRILPHPLNEDSQQTELVNEDYEDLEMSFQIGPSLPPPHQEPVTTMTSFMATPSMTRQSSTVSDKVYK